MPLDSEQETVVRAWVGDDVELEVLDERYDRLGTLDATVEEELRYQLAQLKNQPSSLTLPSGLSLSWNDRVRMAQEQLKDFLNHGSLDDDIVESGTRISKLVRLDASR